MTTQAHPHPAQMSTPNSTPNPLDKAFVLGIDHHRAGVEVRQKLSSVGQAELWETMKQNGAKEGMVLSTCNRFEVYGVGDVPRVLEKLFPEDVRYLHKGPRMARHGLHVTTSLESMVVGENQILGQFKKAYHTAKAQGAAGPVLNRFCQTAFRAGKRVRTETTIGKGQVSVASVAVQAAQAHLGSLSKAHVLLLGTGDMGLLTARHLRAAGVGRLTLLTRNMRRGMELSKQLACCVAPYERLADMLGQADVIIGATCADSGYIVTMEAFENKPSLSTSLGRKKIFIDIAVPRTIDPNVSKLKGCTVLGMDELRHTAQRGQGQRQSATQAAERIIEEELAKFIGWSEAEQNKHMVLKFRRHFETLRTEILAEHGHKGAQEATRRLLNRMLHAPTVAIREGQFSSGQSAEILEGLFDLGCTRYAPLNKKEEKNPEKCHTILEIS